MTGTAQVRAGFDSGEADIVDRTTSTFLADVAARPGSDQDIWGRQFDAGLAWVDFPAGFGGLGVSRTLRSVVTQRLSAAGINSALSANLLGISLAAPVLVTLGNVDQQRRYLRALFDSTEIWCQLFSEPGAGSDLAALATRALRDGDDYVVDGQKVWTSMAHVARWGLLCARTDPDAPKHRGLSMFILDMQAPGVEIRPIRQITGNADFNEVFLSGVRVPAASMIGAPGQGWAGILATLANERASMTETPLPRGGGAIAHAVRLWEERGDRSPELRDQFTRLWTRAEVLRLAERAAFDAEAAGIASPAWSYLKIQRSELDQAVFGFCVTLLGDDGLCYPSYEMSQPSNSAFMTDDGDDARRAYLFSRCKTIAGGTSEVQRTIVADRILGLPREPQEDRNTPWRQLRRS